MSLTTAAAVSPKRGAFILFEGIDRCGKSTQSSLLSTTLANSELIRYPNRDTVIGKVINNYLTSSENHSDETIHLLFSANRWECAASVESKLNAGINLVSDRYAYSGVAFSAAKGMDLSWCKACDNGLIAPDCIIYLDLSIEDASKRGSYGEERYEKIDFQRKVREQFMHLKAEDESSGSKKWHVIDARKSKEEIHAEIISIANKAVNECSAMPITKLWK